jgi:hypothetical protein
VRGRQRRELLFDELEQLLREHHGTTVLDFELRYRKLEDYVFPAVDYQRSKTCCWNRSTAQMAEIILDHAAHEQADRRAEPTPLLMVDGGLRPVPGVGSADGAAGRVALLAGGRGVSGDGVERRTARRAPRGLRLVRAARGREAPAVNAIMIALVCVGVTGRPPIEETTSILRPPYLSRRSRVLCLMLSASLSLRSDESSLHGIGRG